MAADKLAIYNRALAHLASRRLAALTENREPRRVLDDLWADQVLFALEQAPWSFAIRSVQLEPDAGIEPAFGYRMAYAKPVDWLKTVVVAVDERFTSPLIRYTDEGGYWLADASPLFVRFVSSDPAFGGDASRWSPSFTEYLALRLAEMGCQRITGSSDMLANLVKLEDLARKRAKANDALNTPVARPPAGSWVRARFAGGSSVESFSGPAGLLPPAS